MSETNLWHDEELAENKAAAMAMISPARAAGLPARFPNSRTCWSKRDLPRLWTRMRLRVDPRHEGEVMAIQPGVWMIVMRWDCGWQSEHKISELERC